MTDLNEMLQGAKLAIFSELEILGRNIWADCELQKRKPLISRFAPLMQYLWPEDPIQIAAGKEPEIGPP